MQNTSKRPWYLRPVDFILLVFFKSSWSSSGTTDPRQTRQTPGFHLARLVAIKLEPFLNHCSRNAPGQKKAAQGSKKQCRIPAKDLGTSDLWISYCVISSNQVGAPPEPLIHDKHLRRRKRRLKAAKNNAEYQQKTLLPQTCGFHIACFLQIKLEPLRNH